MKFSLFYLLMILSLSLMTFSNQASAQDHGGVGDSGGHGGDTLVTEFTGTMRNILNAIPNVPVKAACIPESDPKRLQNLTQLFKGDPLNIIHKKAFIYSSPFVVLNGHPEDAQNDYKDRINKKDPFIELSRIKLVQIKDPEYYSILTLHEFYGLLGIEGTNDMTHSRECVESLEKQGIKATDLAFKEKPFTSIEEKFFSGDGQLVLDCTLKRDHLVIFTQNRPKEGTSLFIDHDSRSGKFTNIASARFPLKTLDQLLQMFTLEYSIESGLGTIHFDVPLEEGKLLKLETVDHTTWNIQLYLSRRHHKAHHGSCVPVTGKLIQ